MVSAFQGQGVGLPRRPPASPALGEGTCYSTTAPPLSMSSMTQQRNHGSEIRDEAEKPSKMLSFPGGMSFSCCSFLCQGIQEAFGLWSAVNHPPTAHLISWDSPLLLPPSPQAWGQGQFFFCGLWFEAAGVLSSPCLLSLSLNH